MAKTDTIPRISAAGRCFPPFCIALYGNLFSLPYRSTSEMKDSGRFY
jgi:hypothetical protein